MSRRDGDDAVGPASPEEELVRLSQEPGGDAAFAELARRHHERLHAVIYRLVNDRQRAEDLTQETFLRAWRGLSGFQGAAGFYTWIYRIARNVVSSDARRQAARPRVSTSLESSFDDGGGIEVVDEREDPVRRAIGRERSERLIEALEALPPDFKEMLLLRDVEGHAYEEIASMLEIPVGTVRSRLHRARMELKAKLDRGAASRRGRA